MTLPEASSHERKVAAAIHIAGIVAPLWVPAIAYVVFRPRSRFIAAHALQEITDGVIWKVLLLCVMIASLIWTATRLVYHVNTAFAEFTWQEVVFKVILSLAAFIVLFCWNMTQAILQARGAWRGDWTRRERRRAAKLAKT